MAIFNRCTCATHNSSRAKVCKACGAKLGKNYYIQYSIDGKRKIEKIGDSIGYAREVLAKKQTDIREGKHFGTSRSIQWVTFFDKYYRPYCEQNIKSHQEARFISARNFSDFQKLMNKITRTDIENYRKYLDNGQRTKATINRYIQTVKFAFNYAESLELIDKNPTRRMKMYKEDITERRKLEPEDEVKLLEACRESVNPLLYHFVMIALYTGMRYQEILNIKWSHVNFSMGSIMLFKTKTNDSREIPIVSKLDNALKELKTLTGGYEYLFTNPDTQQPIKCLRNAYEKAVEKSGVGKLLIHELRHTLISRLAASGASIPEIQQISGHKTAKMVQRYTHVGLQESRRTMDRLSRYLDE